MSYSSWEPRQRVTTIAPGKLDLFVATLIDGKRAALCSVLDYDAALAKARAFHRDHPCQIKVLPLTAAEAVNLLGLDLSHPPGPNEAADRRLCVATLEGIVCDSNDPDARRDAFDLLNKMRDHKP